MTCSRTLPLVLALLLLGNACEETEMELAQDGGLATESSSDGGFAAVPAPLLDANVAALLDAAADSAPTSPVPLSDAQGGDAGIAPLSTNIVAVGMMERTGFGVGGIITIEYWPVFLLADGTACTDVQFSARGLDAVDHRARYPGNWTRWLQRQGTFYIESSNGKAIALGGRYLPTPAGFTLNDSYSYLSGGGNTAVGGDVLVVSQNTLQFFPDGTFVMGRFAGVSSSNSVTTSAPPDQRGRYSIEGFKLTLSFDNGTTRVSSIIVGSERPVEVFWLGSRAYISESA